MKKILNLQVYFALVLAAAPLASKAQVTFFSDNFTTSTLNQPVAPPTGNSSSYQTYIGLSGGNTTSSIAPNNLSITLPNSASVLGEVVGLFTNTPVPLTAVGDYIELDVVFVDASNILCGLDSANSTINVGLFNSGGVPPNQGNITTSVTTNNINTGGTQDWLGYFGRMFWSGKPNIETRPTQLLSAATAQNQDLLFSGASSTQAFNNPNGTTVGSAAPANVSVVLANGSTYTMQLVITFDTANSLSISNTLYNGAGTGGTVIYTTTNQVATNATFVTGGFDGLAVGFRNSSSSSQASTMDISSILITGHSTPVSGPPTITSQPVSVKVATNGSCAFFVSSIGFGMGYQWHRNGTNLLDAGNISGSTKNMLVISPAGLADVLSPGNGYYVTVSGTGGYTTNSAICSLGLRPATNLIWYATAGTIWDITNSANWQDTNGNQTVFNYGDSVAFNDLFGGGFVTLTGPYLSAASVTVNSTAVYTFNATSSGSFAGPGNLIYAGSGGFTIGNANTYTGGTIISNASAYLILQNLNGLGTGPVTLAGGAGAGGTNEIVPAGGASSSIPNDFVVAGNFTMLFDGTGTYGGDFNGNFSGSNNATLTLTVNPTNTSLPVRVRVYGAATTNNAKLALASSLITLAPYNGTGIQAYNGVISGAGGLIQRGGGITILNGANTYSGGTTPTTGAIGFGINNAIGTGPLYIAPEVADITGSGEVFASGGPITITNSIQYPSATNNLTLIIGGANNLTFSGLFSLNGNDGLGTNYIRYLQTTNSAVTTFSGVISDVTNSVSEGFGLTITGTGTNAIGPLALNNTETYTGPTTITNCTVQVNGQLNAASAVTVCSNATLAGTGIINGAVTVNVGGTLAPSTSSAIGTLTLNGGLTLNGNLFFKVKKLVSQSNDIASVSGTLANGGTGTLTVTNLGPTALVVGDRFKLFNKLVSNGSALTVTGAGVVWTNNLQVDGSISVFSTTLPQPVITSITLSGTNVVFSGNNGTGSSGYYVLSSTNVAAPLSSWTPIFTNNFTSGLFTNTIPIVPGVPDVFYILKLQ
ncbi:MAG: beta strand repeat-containing protein [Limisphaerales bacterium]